MTLKQNRSHVVSLLKEGCVVKREKRSKLVKKIMKNSIRKKKRGFLSLGARGSASGSDAYHVGALSENFCWWKMRMRWTVGTAQGSAERDAEGGIYGFYKRTF